MPVENHPRIMSIARTPSATGILLLALIVLQKLTEKHFVPVDAYFPAMDARLAQLK